MDDLARTLCVCVWTSNVVVLNSEVQFNFFYAILKIQMPVFLLRIFQIALVFLLITFA